MAGMLASLISAALGAVKGIAGELVATFRQMMVGHAVDSLQLELEELENAFATAVLGSMAGLPLVPVGIALELAPHMEGEIARMVERQSKYRDTIADYAGFGG